MSVRTVVVDDSPTMRALVSTLLRRDPAIEVVGTAASAEAARVMIRELDPDVVTLDVEMPGMDGLSFLEKIMQLRPTPVVMVSGRTQRGAAATLRAMDLGAIGCYAKPLAPDGDLFASDDGLLARLVHEAALAAPRLRPPTSRAPAPRRQTAFAWNGRPIALAASTGGVEALGQLLARFPVRCPPVLVVQHMPEGFTAAFAARLDAWLDARVVEAEDGQSIEAGTVYIAPSGDRHMVARGGSAPYLRLLASDPVSGHRPSCDVLFASVARNWGAHGIGVILTGMGDDGARGLLAMRNAGAATIGQDEASALIYGMPRVAHAIGAVAEQLPLATIADRLLGLTGR